MNLLLIIFSRNVVPKLWKCSNSLLVHEVPSSLYEPVNVYIIYFYNVRAHQISIISVLWVYGL